MFLVQNDSQVSADELEVGTQVPAADQPERNYILLTRINFIKSIVFK